MLGSKPLEQQKVLEELSAPERHESEKRRVIRGLLRNRTATAGLTIFLLFVFIATFAPIIAPHDPNAQNLERRLAPPIGLGMENASRDHPLGNDNLGRDILSRLIAGSRVSLMVGVVTVLIASVAGSILGAISGYYRGVLETIIMRVVDAWMAFPGILLAIAFAAALGSGLLNLIIALSLTNWVVYTRIVRAEILSLREREFVIAAQSLGASEARIIMRHLLPNVLPHIVVIATLQMGTVIIAEASLSFLGVGLQGSAPSWGEMLANGRDHMRQAWWMATFPGIAISLVVLGVNLLGDGLRDVLDPRLQMR